MLRQDSIRSLVAPLSCYGVATANQTLILALMIDNILFKCRLHALLNILHDLRFK